MLEFTAIRDLGIGKGFDLTFHCSDASASLYLCVGRADNRVLITGTTPKSRQEAVLAAIDNLETWGARVDLWMTAEKNGVRIADTEKQKVPHVAHVKPFTGTLTIGSISRCSPALTYPGNGIGRLLSRPIGGKRYFIYGGSLETDHAMRGFDCTTFPMVLFEISRLTPPGYGKQVSDSLGGTKCDLEQVSQATLEKKFQDKAIPAGIYILFSEGHILLYSAQVNTIYEFTYGGFK